MHITRVLAQHLRVTRAQNANKNAHVAKMYQVLQLKRTLHLRFTYHIEASLWNISAH